MTDDNLTLYHVSLDIENTIDIFIPRIPQHAFLYGIEDTSTKRICVSPKLEGIFYAMPDLLNYVMDFDNTDEKSNKLSVLTDHCDKIGYLMKVYEFNVKKAETITHHELHQQRLVPDAIMSHEHWLLNPIKPNDFFYLLLTKVIYEPNIECFKSDKFSYVYETFKKNEIGRIRKATINEIKNKIYEIERA